MDWILLYGLLGVFVGFMSGLLGVGGGGLLVPLLALCFRAQDMGPQLMHYVLGTAFACMIFSSLASMRAHAARGNIVWKAFYGMAGGILGGMLVITRLTVTLHATWIAIFFAGFMALIALQMFLNWQPKTNDRPASFRNLMIVGAAIGSISALAAVGGGFLTITYMNYKNFPMKKAVGTSAAIGLPIALAGTLGYLFNGWSETAGQAEMWGFIHVPAFLAIVIASIPAAAAGARLAQRIPDTQLKRIFAVVCVILSLKMIYSI